MELQGGLKSCDFTVLCSCNL